MWFTAPKNHRNQAKSSKNHRNFFGNHRNHFENHRNPFFSPAAGISPFLPLFEVFTEFHTTSDVFYFVEKFFNTFRGFKDYFKVLRTILHPWEPTWNRKNRFRDMKTSLWTNLVCFEDRAARTETMGTVSETIGTNLEPWELFRDHRNQSVPVHRNQTETLWTNFADHRNQSENMWTKFPNHRNRSLWMVSDLVPMVSKMVPMVSESG